MPDKSKCRACGEEFEKRTSWQKYCNNRDCQEKRKRLNSRSWYKGNRKKKLAYMKEYRWL